LVYIPTNSALRLALLKHFADQLPTPFIIMGDFNGHNPLWGSKTTTDKGKTLEDFLSQERLYIFNDGTDTY
jgi:endonuclease/exonuclease/phosphatase family metal-dependent hydrolase